MSNFELSLNKDPFFLQSLIRKGDVYINLGLYDKAKETFIKALQFEESGEILYGIGQCYLKEGNITEGNNFLIKALDKNNKEPIISVNIIKECHFEYN